MFRHPRIGASALTCFAVAALIAGCGGSSPATSRPAAASPANQTVTGAGSTPVAATQAQGAAATSGTASGRACTIFTPDAVAKAVGFPIDGTSGVDTICFYQNKDVSRYLNVTLFDSQTAMAPMLQIESGSEHIAGLGDDAFWVPLAGILFVRVGDHGIELLDPAAASSTSGDTTLRDALVTLARTAVPQL